MHYIGTDGTTWKIGALAAKLDTASRNTLLAAKKDDTLTVEIIKDGNYWNLTAASVGGTVSSAVYKGTQPSSQPAAYTGKGKETDTRIQVMNALTNAVTSLGAGKKTSEYKARVIEFVTLGTEVTEAILAGGIKATPPAAPTAIEAEVTNEVGF